jgi:hypothetical protein
MEINIILLSVNVFSKIYRLLKEYHTVKKMVIIKVSAALTAF